MINTKEFCDLLSGLDLTFFTGVPDSLLKNLCGYLEQNISSDHYTIAANEGNALSIGIGYHIATKKIPVCFLQNSGIGNLINPLTSLTHKKIYSIPALLIIGWRGEPLVKDEPQHVFQGQITEEQLELLDIPYMIIDESTELPQVSDWLCNRLNNCSSPISLLVRKNTFSDAKYYPSSVYSNAMSREDALNAITSLSSNTPIISTTGKTSRELYEIREHSDSHHLDFLTVGGMGHTSSIALGMALAKKNRKVICLDGDGSLIMHMGALAIISEKSPRNLKYILLNNSAHESVGGQPTVASTINFKQLCSAFNIPHFYSASNINELKACWNSFFDLDALSFLEVKIKIGSRDNLSRPKTTPAQNKEIFMQFLNND